MATNVIKVPRALLEYKGDHNNLSLGDYVYLDSTGILQLASTDILKSPCIGIITKVATPTLAYVSSHAKLTTALPDGVYYISSTPGTISLTVPDGDDIVCQEIARVNNGILTVEVKQHYIRRVNYV